MDADSLMRARFGALLMLCLVALCAFVPSSMAHADGCSEGSSAGETGATPGVTGILISGEQSVSGQAGCGDSEQVTQFDGPRDSGLDALCVREALSQGR